MMLLSPLLTFLVCASPAQIRPLRTFVESEVKLPDGPRKGDTFDASWPAWVGDLMLLMTGEQWAEIWMTGPRQTGKTLMGFSAPLLYHLFEVGEDIICLVPEMRKAEMIWKKKILP